MSGGWSLLFFCFFPNQSLPLCPILGFFALHSPSLAMSSFLTFFTKGSSAISLAQSVALETPKTSRV
uniref:Uncharacterized protein n=1 Tax=Phakopsora pachyrhizi TaxID=170000 RepID=A0A0S1MIK8_PHAPC